METSLIHNLPNLGDDSVQSVDIRFTKTRKNGEKMSKRIVGIDVFRGFMIFYVILLHPLLQRVFAQDASEFGNQMTTLPLFIVILGIPFFILALWGSAFTMLTAVATAYQMSIKMQKNPSNKQIDAFTRSKWINSLLIIGFHWFYLALFSNRSPDFNTTSLITGFLETGNLNEFSFFQMLTGGTLESIAIIGIIVTLILKYLWKDAKFNPNYAKKVFFTLGLITILITILFENLMPDPWSVTNYLFSQNNYIGGLTYMRLFSVRFSMFPMLAFGFFGALFGLMLADNTSYKFMIKFAAKFLIVGIFIATLYLISGYDILTHFAEEHTPIMMQVVNLGLQLIVLMAFIVVFDYTKSNFLVKIQNTEIIKRIKKILLRYNLNSLTIFVVEPFISILVYRIMQVWYPYSFSTNWGVIILYEIIVIAIWFGLLKQHQKIGYKYNLEWIIARLKKNILRKMDEKSNKQPIEIIKIENPPIENMIEITAIQR